MDGQKLSLPDNDEPALVGGGEERLVGVEANRQCGTGMRLNICIKYIVYIYKVC